jgi:tRNA U34 2-thiouridine synthase MnmA/TrmU
MDCNKYIKFGVFKQHVLNEIGADMLATGELP